jgi:CubicO group peptidase (beta-lactamase class C family)
VSVAQILANRHVPAAQVLHRRGAETLLEVQHGSLTEQVPSRAVDEHSVFQAASLSKVVFSYLALRAVDSGLVDLDTPLSTYLETPRTRSSTWGRAITTRHVLTHTTGLPNWADGAGTEDSVLNPTWEPGSRFTYSGDGFFLLQQTLEALDGRSLDILARDEVFRPWGMQDSSFVVREADAPHTAAGHALDGRETGISHFTRANAAFTLTTTARDYSEFLRRAVCAGEGLSPELHRAWLSPSSDAVVDPDRTPPSTAATLSPVSWGLGVGLEETDAERLAWHWGDNGPHRAFFVAFPEVQETAVMFFASARGHLAVPNILGALFPDRTFVSPAWVDEYDRLESEA